MSTAAAIPTVADRWRACSGNSTALAAMPPEVRDLAAGIFYAGFYAGLEAMSEAADLPDRSSAMVQLQAMVSEVAQFHATIERTAIGGPSQ